MWSVFIYSFFAWKQAQDLVSLNTMFTVFEVLVCSSHKIGDEWESVFWK